MIVIEKQKIAALKKLAESHWLAAKNQIMFRNLEVLDEVASEYVMLQKRHILWYLRQREREIELAHAFTKAMDPKLTSLANEDADSPSATVEEEREGL